MKQNNRICEQCETPFFAFPSRIKIGKARFCTSTCRDAAATTGRTTNATCAQCGDLYYAMPSTLHESKYCSQECKSEAQAIERKGTWTGPPTDSPIRLQAQAQLNERRKASHFHCDYCGEQIEKPNAHRPGRKHFCNREHYTLWRRSTKIESADVEMYEPRRAEKDMTVVYDSVRKELRNV